MTGDAKNDGTKTALIMEGGAMRGMFTCGVIDVLLENDVEFDGSVGISAGAVFGCNFKSKQIGRAIRYNKKYSKDPRYGKVRSFIKTGNLYETQFCYFDIPFVLDPFDSETFRANPTEFYVGATDVMTGAPVYHKCVEAGVRDVEWIGASSSMPIVSNPVTIDGRQMLDGGITDAVPFEFMEGLGYNRNVVVLTRPYGYRKSPIPATSMLKLLLRRYPAVAEAMIGRPEMYNRQMQGIEQRERDGVSFVIRPPEDLGIHRTEDDPVELERVYNIGRAETERVLPDLVAFLEA